jgi:hypothetical protein
MKITNILGGTFSLKKLLADEVQPEEFDESA